MFIVVLFVIENKEKKKTPGQKKKKENKARCSGSHLESQNFGMPRREDHLRSGVQDQPGQHSKLYLY